MRRTAAVVAALLLLLAAAVPAFAAAKYPKLDGVDSGAEWRDATQLRLVSGESNSGVTYGAVKYLLDLKAQRVYLCFLYIDPAVTAETAGVYVTLADAAPIVCTAAQPPASPDPFRFSVEGALGVDDQHGVTCELCIGVKEGIEATLPVHVQFIDANGIPSNRYAFEIVNPAAQTAAQSAGGDETERDTTIATTTQRPTTTGGFAGRQGAVNYTYPYVYNYTVAPRTTAEPVTEPDVQTTVEKSTKEKTTKEKTTKARTTRAAAAAGVKTPAETVVREVVIMSQVYVPAETTTAVPPEMVAAYAKGRNWQMVAIAATGVLLAVLGAYAVTGSRRKDGQGTNGDAPDAPSEPEK